MRVLDSLHPRPKLRVLVTGGAGGVGATIARAFHEAGACVHVCDIDRAALDRIGAKLPGITTSMADVALPADVDGVFDDVAAIFGGLDVLICTANIAGPTCSIEHIDPPGWERTMAVNVHGPYLFARRAAPLLNRSRAGPCVVAVAPAARRVGRTMSIPSATGRWAIVGLVESLAVELEPQGVRVNAILLGAADGGPAEDAAALALFLCSPAARGLTGQAIAVGGKVEHLRTQFD